MKNITTAIAVAVTIGLGVANPAAASEPAAQATSATDPAMQEVIGVVEGFGKALKAADMATAARLLDEKVLILESGGAERSREAYLGHHAVSDAAFLAGATVTPKRRSAQVYGDTAWVGTESEILTGQGDDARTLLSTETMVLRRQAGDWKIVHIHWSSRPKKAGAP
ncbi:MAG: YybH family protein [Pseudomonadota bacterium]